MFRKNEGETVVLILNKNNEPITLDLKRYSEIGLDGKTLKNVITEENFDWNDSITLNDRGVTVLTTKLN